ncbi:HNH endonuclease signature motif containing protein [Pseudonocardia kongjuensis]|uniref:HNH endonuclease signature motif containing protein n=2 Tax=Pseudonocardia kongjuensis TaxID=102227 RepID=A0ABN1YA55_9PSEU
MRYCSNMWSSEGGSDPAPGGADPGGADPVVAVLGSVLEALAGLPSDPGGATGAGPAVRIDRIALFERLRAVVAAGHGAEIVGFARAAVEERIAAGDLDPRTAERGIADQVALACRISPSAGSRRLGSARALHLDLPRVCALLRAGRISEEVAEHVVSETRHLDREARRSVDEQLAGAGIDELGRRAAAALARRLAYECDPAAYVARGRTARTGRRVGLRPAPDTMAVLSAYLPVEQGVACLAALRRHADAVVGAGSDRNRDQIMADTLVERLTGQARAADVNVELGIVIGVDQLVDPAAGGTAEIVGHGPVPVGIARDILAGTQGRRWWRRLFARPAGGLLVGADPRRRYFGGVPAALVRIRDDDRCRDPYCDAPGRHIDHIVPARRGGPTTPANGRTVCVRGNLVRELPGWSVEVLADGLGDTPHTVRTTTPTGHTYLSRARRTGSPGSRRRAGPRVLGGCARRRWSMSRLRRLPGRPRRLPAPPARRRGSPGSARRRTGRVRRRRVPRI